jgi:type VI protein secretion system component VasK
MSKVDPRIRNAVVAAGWAVPVVLLLSGAVAAGIYIVRVALFADVQAPQVTLGSQTSLLLVLGLVGSVAGLYWVLTRWTFGPEFVDNAVDSGADAAEAVQDQLDD